MWIMCLEWQVLFSLKNNLKKITMSYAKILLSTFNANHAMGKFSRRQTDNEETICMKSLILFSRKNKKNILICRPLKFLPSMQSVNG